MRARLVMGCVALWATAAVGAGSNPRDATPRLTYQAPVPVTDAAGMGAWLTRMAGRYKVEGMIEVVLDHRDFDPHRCGAVNPDGTVEEPFCQSIRGQADCVTIGDGPGIQCIIHAHWQDMFFIVTDPPTGEQRGSLAERPPPPGVYNLPGGNPFLAPAMLLMGMDPHRGGLNFLLVDDKGLPEGGAGTIASDRATLRSPCVNGPALLNRIRQDLIGSRLPRSCDRILRIDAAAGSSVVNLAFDIRVNEETYTRIDITLRRQ